MHLDLQRTSDHVDRAMEFFEENGYLELSGLGESIVGGFRRILAETIGIADDAAAVTALLAADREAYVFPRDVRERLARLATPRPFALTLLSELAPILTRLIGPLAHVSSTFHSQFKGGVLQRVEHYHNENAAEFMELHGAWNLHQDFAGASLPTSPSGLTLWVPLNTSPDWTLRLYPGSHRLGLFCNRLWTLDDPRLKAFAPPVDLAARVGSGVLFNAMVLHGTSNPGPLRRVSCDLRFFPLCGFLPSEVHIIASNPLDSLRERQRRTTGPTLSSPLLESLVLLGDRVQVDDPPPHSALNWVKYLAHVMDGEPQQALPYLQRFINTDLLEDPPSVFVERFHGRPLHGDNLRALKSRVAA